MGRCYRCWWPALKKATVFLLEQQPVVLVALNGTGAHGTRVDMSLLTGRGGNKASICAFFLNLGFVFEKQEKVHSESAFAV